MTQSKDVRPILYARAQLPNPRSFTGIIVMIQEANGVLHPWFSNGSSWAQVDAGGGSATWGGILGDLSSQSDIIDALATKATLQTGALAPSTTQAPNATGVQNAISAAISGLVGGAGPALDALNELAAALGNDANFAATVAASISAKQNMLSSGSNIKTINNESILGPGNLTVAGGGGAPVERVAFPVDGKPPLDTDGNGKAAPLVFGDRHEINSALTLIATPINEMTDGASFVASVRVNAPVDYSAFQLVGLPPDPNFDYEWAFLAAAPKALFISVRGEAFDIVAPTIGTPAVANSARTIAVFPITELTSLNGTIGGVTLSGAAAAGRSVVGVAVVGSELRVTLNIALAAGDVLNIALAAGMVRDNATVPNLSAAKAATAVTNNIIPNPVFSAQTPPDALENVTYGPYTLVASNATSFAVQSGALPTGVDLDGPTGVLSGNATTPGSYNVTFRATGPGGFTDSTPQTIEITAAGGLLPYTTDFDGPDSTTNFGAGWVPVDGGDFGILGNEGYSSELQVFSKIVREAGVADVLVQHKGKIPGNGNNSTTILRYTDGDNFIYVRHASGAFEVGEIFGGVNTTINSGVAATADNDVEFTVDYTLDGTQLTLGGPAITAPVTLTVQNVAGTKFGVGVWNDPTTGIKFTGYSISELP